MPSVAIENTAAPGPHGPVPVRTYVPRESVGVGLVWLHGGGFHSGDLDVPEAHWVAQLLAAAGITVVSAHYRLANDGVHYPVLTDDVLAAWTWATTAAGLGSSVGSWHIGGGSAGGNLAASTAVQLRDRGETLPRSSVLIYPVLHDVLPAAPDDLLDRIADAPLTLRFDAEKSREANLNYVGQDELLSDPYAFPAHAHHAGLPPTLIVTSELDELRMSGEAYAAALAAAGVDVTLVREPGTWHGHLNEVDTPPALRTVDRMIAWLTHTALLGAAHVPVAPGAPRPPFPAWAVAAPGGATS